jgi:hypothetical protein
MIEHNRASPPLPRVLLLVAALAPACAGRATPPAASVAAPTAPTTVAAAATVTAPIAGAPPVIAAARAGTSASTVEGVDAELAAIAQVHGGAGPWVVAGYRMGEFALKRLGLPRGSFDLEVIHHSPREVQYSCVADGAATATGASLGKLNLSLVEVTAARTHTLYRRRSTGQSVDLRVTRAFAARYLDVPLERLPQAGREVIALPDADIFTVVDDAHP